MASMRVSAVIASSILVLGSFNQAAPAAASSEAAPAVGSAPATAGWMAQVQQDLAEKEYDVSWQTASGLEGVGDAWQAPNRAHGFRTWFTPEGIHVVPRAATTPEWRWGLALAGSGRGGESDAVPRATVVPSGRRIEYRRGAFLERYENTPDGLKQTFTIPAPPAAGRRSASTKPVHLDLVLWGDLSPRIAEDGQAIDFVDSSGAPILHYGSLQVTDARGEALPATMDGFASAGTRGIRLVADTSTAVYPITFAVLTTSWVWTVWVNQDPAHRGAVIATAGDVNGDGYSDVVVGAPGYDNGLPAEGLALLYLGSSTGLPTMLAWEAEGNDAFLEFGYSLASAGDVNGDGFDDVIVGAGNSDYVTRGQARLYLGSAAGLSPAPSWTAMSEPAGVTTFGASVAGAGDVNDDGYDDVIVADPEYTLGVTRAGKVYVYLGGASGLAASAAWTVEGTVFMEFLGYSVARAGDLNADGYSDILISGKGYWEAPTGTPLTLGRVRAYLGSAAGLSAIPSWTVVGDQSLGGFGVSVSTAGDVNGDGYADVLVGADNYSNGQAQEGRVYGYLGSASGLSATAAWTVESNATASLFGHAVATAGDVNGDGYADAIVGAATHPNGGLTTGKAFVYLGSSTGLAAGPAWTALAESIQPGFGGTVATAGDVNGDGFSDVLVGAPVSGRSYLFLGSGAGTRTTRSWQAVGAQFREDLGYSVAGAGDVNGDGYSDVIIGSPAWDGGQIDAGRALVYLGSASGLATSAAWTREGDGTGGSVGISVASAGDVNGDGYADVIVGASGFGVESSTVSGPGHAEVFLGAPSGPSAIPDWYLSGEQFGARFGESVASAGDVNGDGYSDVVIGARDHSNGQSLEGRAFVYLGSPLGLATSPAWMAEGDLASAHFGTSVASAGDTNRDGYSDVIVGAFGYDEGVTINGRASLFLGSSSGLATLPVWAVDGGVANDWFGYSVATAGDVNRDGYADVIIGAPFSGGGYGRALVYLGSGSGTLAYAWAVTGSSIGDLMGVSVATAGDVNGDGYSDVATMAYDRGAYIFHGSSTGPSTTYDWTGNSGGGDSIATAGDVNGDGFSDVITGYSYGASGGEASVFYGNGGAGLRRLPVQARTDGSAPIALLGRSDSGTSLRLKLRGVTPAGRDDLRMQWEVRTLGTPFGGPGVGVSSIQNTGVPGVSGSATSFDQLIGGLAGGTTYRWRARTVSRNPFFPRSPWFSIQGDSVTEAKVRTPLCIDLDGDGYGATGDPNCQAGTTPDCNDADPGAWQAPGEVLNLTFTSSTSMTWDAPAAPGTVSPLVYDTLRTRLRGGNFLAPFAICVESDDGPNTGATDADVPPVGDVYFYQVRAQNTCPAGQGSLGFTSDGVPRPGRTCP